MSAMSERVEAATWRFGVGEGVPLDQPALMGILNVTPDSFSDGGAYADVDAALERAGEMIDAGARLIDVGGESTRPGAARVEAGEQIRRTQPVIEAIARRFSHVVISIDTTRSAVAAAGLDAGAQVINDVSAGMEDDAMFALAASRRAGLILMHRVRPPDSDQYSDQYAAPPIEGNVITAVAMFLQRRIDAATAACVAREAIVVDPGLGFGKTVEQNYELIMRSGLLQAQLGRPLLSGASRKSFIGKVAGVERATERDAGSVAVTVLHAQQGVKLFRVHDVDAHRQALAVTQAASIHRKDASETEKSSKRRTS